MFSNRQRIEVGCNRFVGGMVYWDATTAVAVQTRLQELDGAAETRGCKATATVFEAATVGSDDIGGKHVLFSPKDEWRIAVVIFDIFKLGAARPGRMQQRP